MYAGFEIKSDNVYSDYYEKGKSILSKYDIKAREDLSKFMVKDGSLNGSEIQENWFPQIDADIFISHSHNDYEMAVSLAGWLYDKFKLKAFIDSCIWGYSDDLLKLIDKKYCYDESDKTYDYEKRNYSTSHVHMMLSTALAKMIDNTECMFFLNTPNSIVTEDFIRSGSTQSPWIYFEIAISKLIQKICPQPVFNDSSKLSIKYNLDNDHLHPLNQNDLSVWEKQAVKTSKRPLDVLYELIGKREENNKKLH